MQIIKTFIKLAAFILPIAGTAQSTYLTQGSKEFHFIDRLEIKYGKNTDINFSSTKPYSRKFIVQEAEFIDSVNKAQLGSIIEQPKKWMLTSKVDDYNMRSLLMNNSEWVTGSQDDFKSKRPWFKTFYKTKPNLFEVNPKDFFLVVNPVLQFSVGSEKDNNNTLYVNSRGVTLRGMITRKIGFSTTLVDNQERGPSNWQEAVTNLRAVPGVGFYKTFKGDATAKDYFDARGYFTFNVAKYIDFQFGYDKNFIGDGYRSLFLSDFGNSYLFLRLNTKIWKLNYQNIFMELIPQYKKDGDNLLPRKYAAMHHLSMNVTKWLNLGLFEGVVFGRTNHFDFEYLNPIIFYRSIEGTIGSPDNALAGFDFKANVAHKFQFYGQLLLDEFILSKVKDNPGYWANKFAIQLGGKYIDAFGVKNLDLQGETNWVRPFTYSHNDTIANYTHYNQPLAHPLGSNFQEFIGIARYQPFPKWYINGRLIYYYKGLDSSGINFGGNIFKSYNTRIKDDGFDVGSGKRIDVLNAILEVSYEIKQNLFFDFTFQQRNTKYRDYPGSNTNSTFISGGVRLNMVKRTYDY